MNNKYLINTYNQMNNSKMCISITDKMQFTQIHYFSILIIYIIYFLIYNENVSIFTSIA